MAALTRLRKSRTQPGPLAWGAPGRPKGMDRVSLGGLQRLSARRRPRRRTRLQTQVREDFLDNRRFQDRGDDLQPTAAVRAVLHVDVGTSDLLDRCLALTRQPRLSGERFLTAISSRPPPAADGWLGFS